MATSNSTVAHWKQKYMLVLQTSLRQTCFKLIWYISI